MKPTVNEIFKVYGAEYRKQNPFLTVHAKKTMRAIELCRTEELGGRIEQCNNCGHTVTLYNSCRNRHCPQCQFLKKEKWVLEKKNDVLPFQYFHIVFTLPDKLNKLVYRNKRIIYKLLFLKVKETLLSVSSDKKYFGAKIGFFSILHTWGQKLNLHPHIHCVVPGGGYSEEKQKWIKCRENYLFPVEVLKKRFRSLFLRALKELYSQNKLYVHRTEYAAGHVFQDLIDKLFQTNWVVYIKESFRNSDSVIEYLGRYTHRIAISNYRILKVENDIVYFTYKDYKEDNKKKIMAFPVYRFIRRFLLHIVPMRFVRIRYFGLLSHRNKKKNILDCFEFYNLQKRKPGSALNWQDVYFFVTGKNLCKCPKCKTGTLVFSDVIPKCLRAPPIKTA